MTCPVNYQLADYPAAIVPVPQVSVLMSVYNKGTFLKSAIDSILDQSFTNFEFIIRDNYSTDDSVAIIEGYSDPRIRFSRNSRNLGPVVSINRCLEDVCGMFVTFAHGDDLWEADFLETSISSLESCPEATVSYSLSHSMNEHGLVTLRLPDPHRPDLLVSSGEEVLIALFRGCFINMPAAVIRRSAISFLDVRYVYTCDWDLWLRTAVAGNSFLFINRPLIRYRTSTDSETSSGMVTGEMILESYLTLQNFFRRHPQYRKYRRDSLRRLANGIMRRSRDINGRETIFLYHMTAIICSPVKLLNPFFHLLFLVGQIFGPRGLKFIKTVSRSFTRAFKKKIKQGGRSTVQVLPYSSGVEEK